MLKRGRRKWTLTVLALFVLSGAVLLTNWRSSPVQFTSPSALAAINGSSFSVADVAERVLPGVVNIASTRTVKPSESPFQNHPFFREFFRRFQPTPRQQRGLGSGVLLKIDGTIVVVTNNHVVAKADKIRVALSDGREYDAKVIGTDPKSDLAVLKLKGVKGLKTLSLGNSTRMRLGDVVLAIGNPFGVGQTVTMGIVSATGRANVGIVDYENFIQTDAAINPGNSGGALVNMRGELIGINTAILSRSGGYQGIGFAIPANMVRPIVRSLLKTGKVVRGWLGVAIQNVNRDLARALKLPSSRGVLVTDVDPRGPARKAGLRGGDLVTAVNGEPVASTGKLRNLIASAGAKTRVRLDVVRGGKRMSLDVRLAELPARLGGTAGRSGRGHDRALAVAPIDATTRNRYNIPNRIRRGVVVTAVRPRSKAAEAGLRSGDVILEINRVKVSNVGRFYKLLSASRGQILLLVHRGGFSQYLLMPK